MIGYYPINPAGGDAPEDAFGPRFFRTQFADQMKQMCAIDEETPVLEMVLTSGQVLDVAYIAELKSDYLLVCVFVDNRDCASTYNTYIRYATIYRINTQSRPVEERPIGFSNRTPKFDVAPTKNKPTKPTKTATKKKKKK